MIGTILRARYEIVQSLGETPLFQVFAARDRLQSREVCVRLLRAPFSSETDFVAKMAEVCERLSAVTHPNLERIFGFETDAPTPFLVTDLSKGTSLAERLRKLGTLSVPVAVQNAITVCEATQALHKVGIIHADLGAHNIVVNAEGETRLQLFGIWKSLSFSQSAGHAALPAMAPYLAPEITKGDMPSAASDVYAIGVLLFEMLAGRQPFMGDTPVAVALKHLNEAAPNVRTLNPSVPIVLAEVMKKAMLKTPDGRYRDAAEMLSDLRILQDALRFGRSLSWPIREERTHSQAPSAEPTPAPATPILAPREPVAPKMSAARPESNRKKVDRSGMVRKEVQPVTATPGTSGAAVALPEAYDPDVPVWLKVLIAFFAGLLVVIAVMFLAFNVNKPRQVEIPNLARLPFSEASTRLTDLNLKARVQSRQTSESVPAEQVIASVPEAGEKVFEGSAVSLVVSQGSAKVQVPDLTGVNMDDAQRILASVGLRLDGTIEEVRSRSVAKGLVLEQTPAKGARVDRQSSVRVKFSAGDGRDTSIRSPAERFMYRIEFTISDLPNPVQLRIDMTDASGTRTVHNMTYDPNATDIIHRYGQGTPVTLRFYYDGELVKTMKAEPTSDPESER